MEELNRCIVPTFSDNSPTGISAPVFLSQKGTVFTIQRINVILKEALQKLADIITANNLSVEACEYEFETAHWKEAGEEIKLGSRTDMLLSDKNGGKVIFDFKYSDSKSRKTEVEENRALQLEVYRYLAKQNFGERVPVRVAYVLLPDVNIITADSFENVETINVKADRKDVNIMLEAADSYRFRWEQLKSGKIERVEGEPVGTGEYAEHTTERALFPLSAYDKKYSEDRFDKGYKNLK